jgi:hypothetical protein
MFPSEGIRFNQARCRDHGKIIDYSRIFPGAALDEVSQDNRDETCASYDIIEVRGSGEVVMELIVAKWIPLWRASAADHDPAPSPHEYLLSSEGCSRHRNKALLLSVFIYLRSSSRMYRK